MADRTVDHLIIGGGIAGWSCARALRDGGAGGSLLVVGRELDPPYDRTLCSKSYLRGAVSRDDALLCPSAWWEQQRVELQTRTSVMKVDAEKRLATLSSKEVVEFGTALIATGALVRRLQVDGLNLDGVHYLRTLGNSDQILRDVEAANHVVLIGGSYIATEVAASLTALGKSCTLVMEESVTLERSLGKTAGRFLQGVLESRGVTVQADDALVRVEGDDHDRVRRVVTRRGRELGADLVVIGAGVLPDVQLARSAGLELGEGGGIRTDSRLETSKSGIYAAGDVCEYDSELHGRPLRVEHWEVAAAQGRRAAASMLGGAMPDEEVPYFFSDLADWVSLEYIGPAASWEQEVVRGSIAEGDFSLWYLHDGRVAAVLSVGRSDDLDAGRRLLTSRASVDAANLADERFALAELG